MLDMRDEACCLAVARHGVKACTCTIRENRIDNLDAGIKFPNAACKPDQSKSQEHNGSTEIMLGSDRYCSQSVRVRRILK